MLSIFLSRGEYRILFSFFEFNERLIRTLLPIQLYGQDVIFQRNLKKKGIQNNKELKKIFSNSLIFAFLSIPFVVFLNYNEFGEFYLESIVFSLSSVWIIYARYITKLDYHEKLNVRATFFDGVYSLILIFLLVYLINPSNVLSFVIIVFLCRLSVIFYKFHLLPKIKFKLNNLPFLFSENNKVALFQILKRFTKNSPLFIIGFLPYYSTGDFEVLSVLFRIAFAISILDLVEQNILLSYYTKNMSLKINKKKYLNTLRYSLPFIVLVFLFGNYILGLWELSNEINYSALIIFCFSQFINSLTLNLSTFLRAKSMDKSLLNLSFISFLIIVALSIILYKHFGIIGVSYSYLLGSIFRISYFLFLIKKFNYA